MIRAGNAKAGLVLNPATPLQILDEVLDSIDLVLVMSVNPGFGGQSFIPSSLTKLARIKSIIDQADHNIRLQIDGGIKPDNIGAAAAAGADTFVAGTAIFASPDYSATISEMRRQIALAGAG